MAARFWILNVSGTPGIFNNTAHWSATSGGSGGASVPVAGDTITWDANGVAGCIFDIAVSAASLTATAGYTGGGANDGHLDNATNDQAVTITANVTLDNKELSMGDATWTITGDWDSADVTTVARGSVTSFLDMIGTTKLIVGGTHTYNLKVSGGATIEISSTSLNVQAIDIQGTLSIPLFLAVTATDTGTQTTTDFTGTVTGAGTLFVFRKDITAIGTLDVDNFSYAPEAGGNSLIAGTYASATVTIFTIDATGQLDLSGNYTFTGNVSFAPDSSQTLTIANSTSDPNLTFQGNLTFTEASGTLTWTKGTGVIKFSGTSAQSIDVLTKVTEGWEIDKASETATLTSEATVDSFLLTAGLFAGGSADIDVNGLFSFAAGTFTSTSATLFLGGDVTLTSGTFTHNSGLMRLDGPTKAINTGSQTFNDITIFIDAGDLDITGTIDCDGTLIILQVNRIDGGIISVAGDITLSDANVGGDGRLLIDGTGTQTMQVDGVGGSGQVPSIDLDKASGDLVMNDNITMAFDSFGFIVTNGTFTHNGTFTFGNSTSSLDIGSNSFNNFVVGGSAPFVNTIVGTVKVTGSFSTLGANVIYNGGTFELTGASLTGNSGSFAGTTVTLINGTGTQTMNGGNFPAGTFTIDKASGTLILAANQVFSISGQDVTLTNGILDLDGFDFTVDDVFTMASGTRLRVKGDEAGTIGTPSIDNASTVEFFDSAVTAVLDNILTTYGNLELGDGKTHNVTDTATITINGTFSSNAASTSTRSVLRSTTPGTQWSLILNGTSTLADLVDVRDSDANGGLVVNAIGSIGDNQNNLNWKFNDVVFEDIHQDIHQEVHQSLLSSR